MNQTEPVVPQQPRSTDRDSVRPRGLDQSPGEPFTAVPNSFIDWVMAECTGAEVKIVLYIARRTYGTERGRARGRDAISITQMAGGIRRRDGSVVDRGTGLSRETIVESLPRLELK